MCIRVDPGKGDDEGIGDGAECEIGEDLASRVVYLDGEVIDAGSCRRDANEVESGNGV